MKLENLGRIVTGLFVLYFVILVLLLFVVIPLDVVPIEMSGITFALGAIFMVNLTLLSGPIPPVGK